MALRVAEPLPLRTLGIAAVALGALIVEAAAAYRPSAIVGLVLIALGAVLLDGVRDRRLTPRHVGLFSLIVGASLSSWAAIVLAVMALFDLDPGGHLVMLLSVGAVGAATGIVLLRRPVTEEASDRSTGRANSKAGPRVRTSRTA
jgi:drug/metabolite transporter (DMT)-like permease